MAEPTATLTRIANRSCQADPFAQLVVARFHRGEVQTLNDPNACAEQDQMRLDQIAVEAAHGEVVEADGLNAGGGEDGGGFLRDINKIFNKFT